MNREVFSVVCLVRSGIAFFQLLEGSDAWSITITEGNDICIIHILSPAITL